MLDFECDVAQRCKSSLKWSIYEENCDGSGMAQKS